MNKKDLKNKIDTLVIKTVQSYEKKVEILKRESKII